ncbi:MAG TPA: circularly permuted type 2 ATP-grasp protein [Solirubrobacteraceae bacterium]|nr:circularly permuted type 2 ATP-grasp protein [Solirubrobacteraceae bacterium]
MTAPAEGSVGRAYDEAFAAPGTPRPHYADLLAALAGMDLAALRAAVNERVEAEGVTFTTDDGTQAFVIDPVPRILPADEWAALAAGLEQRVRALNAFVVDAYGQRRIVEAGLMGAEVIDTAEGYEADLRGALPAGPPPVGVAGLDVVRAPDGRLRVLEDNARTPSGFTYAVAARRAVVRALNGTGPEPEPLSERLYALLRDALCAAAPEGRDPSIVVLSDGPSGAAWYEHAEVARRLEVPVVTLADLERRGNHLEVRLEDGRRRPVDVVYRRCEEDRLRDARGDLTPVAEALLEPWLAGRVGVVNAFGTGVADDKLVYGYVEEMIRFYLGEAPLLEAVPTLDPRYGDVLELILDDLRAYVVKPRMGHGGKGVVVGAHADEATLERLRADLARDPGAYVAQPIVPLSKHPTVVDPGRLETRHVDLRPFVFTGTERTRALPGGLTRVAWDAGALVVNSSQNGGAKDTWVSTSGG